MPEVIDLVSDSETDDENEAPRDGFFAAELARRPRAATPAVLPSRHATPPDFGLDDDFWNLDNWNGDHDLPALDDEAGLGAFDAGAALRVLDPDWGFVGIGEAMRPAQPRQLPQPIQQPQQAVTGATDHAFEYTLALDRIEVSGIDSCLPRVLELFPDVSHDYVTKLYNEFDVEGDYQSLPGSARLDNIIEKLLIDASYPKQPKENKVALKRKRAESVDADLDRWQREDREVLPGYLTGSMRSMLKSEFPTFPVVEIQNVLAAKKHFFQAYVHLAHLSDTDNTMRKGRPSARFADADTIAANSGQPDLLVELAAARKRVLLDRKQRLEATAKKNAEMENLQKAIKEGQTAECQACFDDLPMNRQMHCNGGTAHFTCFSCVETYIKSEIGESRCRVECTAGCGAGFDHNQLNLLSDKALLAKLAQLEQEKAIRDAGLDDLEECPFCDYKAILPPIEEDFEFRCANPTCEKVSCRRCKSVTHIPLSCEQHAKDNKINGRHKIEEAMTAALIRACNGCKKQFIKDYGCNKMTCPSCAHKQCYVCSKSVNDYNHFNQAPGAVAGNNAGSKCPLYDNAEERHDREVKAAEDAAKAELLAANPDVSAEDLEIKVSDAVKTATAARIRQAGPDGLGGGGMGFGAMDAAQQAQLQALANRQVFRGDRVRLGPAAARPERHMQLERMRAAMVLQQQPQQQAQMNNAAWAVLPNNAGGALHRAAERQAELAQAQQRLRNARNAHNRVRNARDAILAAGAEHDAIRPGVAGRRMGQGLPAAPQPPRMPPWARPAAPAAQNGAVPAWGIRPPSPIPVPVAPYNPPRLEDDDYWNFMDIFGPEDNAQAAPNNGQQRDQVPPLPPFGQRAAAQWEPPRNPLPNAGNNANLAIDDQAPWQRIDERNAAIRRQPRAPRPWERDYVGLDGDRAFLGYGRHLPGAGPNRRLRVEAYRPGGNNAADVDAAE